MTRLEVAGTLRCTTTGDWELLSDTAHVPIGGLTLLQQTSTYLKVGFDPADQIHTFIVAPDETLAKAGIFGGASVGLDNAVIYLRGPSGQLDPALCTNPSANLWIYGLFTVVDDSSSS